MKQILFLLALLCLNHFSKAQIGLTTFATGFTQPVDIKHCNDDRLFIVQQNGYIKIADTNGVVRPAPFLDIHTLIVLGSEQGLLGLAFPPDYKTSGCFYVDYTCQPSGYTRISRFHVSPLDSNLANAASEEILLTIYQPYSNHNGGHLAFGPDGYLYIGMGDGGSGGDPGNRAQNPDTLLGKILRIDVSPAIPTYAIPASNIFASDTTLGRPEIWSMGSRNPWRWSFDRANGDLWIGDVGQNVVEEIDYVPAGTPSGLNFGWRCYEGNQAYNTSGCQPYSYYTPPVFTYTHTGGACSITGGYMHRGGKSAELYGKYFYCDYCVSNIHYLRHLANGTFPDVNLGSLGAAAVVAFGEDKWGELYCSGYNSGIIYRFTSANCAPASVINAGIDTISVCGSGPVELKAPIGKRLSYAWYQGGTPVGTDSSSYTTSYPGQYSVTVTNPDNGCTSSDSVLVQFLTPPSPVITGLDTVYCIYNPPVSFVPSPLGGTLSGAGITGLTFDPAAAGIGMSVVTYSYTDSHGCSGTYTQNVRVDLCTGFSDTGPVQNAALYPSPNNGEFTLLFSSLKPQRLQLSLLNVLGENVYTEEITSNAGEQRIPIRALHLADGVYVLRIANERSASEMRMVVRN
jgi:hypothetical protein